MHYHHHNDYVDVVAAQGPTKLSAKMRNTYLALIVLGVVAFVFSILVLKGQERIGWISLLHNFYFFTGLSAAGVVISAVMQVARGFWGRPVKRYAEAMGAFLPIGLIALVLLYLGAWLMPETTIWEWVVNRPDHHLYENKHWWLRVHFVFPRALAAVAILWAVSKIYISASVRPDLGLASEKNSAWSVPSGWTGSDSELPKARAKQAKWAVVYCICYAVCISMLAYDLVMSLDFRWFSTMFGPWNFTSFMLIGFGSLVLISYFMSERFGVSKFLNQYLFHDLGKLTFGFTVVWGYLFFAQLMVIWYGNLPHETGYLITRFVGDFWKPLGLTVIAMVFLIPFCVGLSKKIKLSPKTFAPVVICSFVGIWLERFLLITPASWYFKDGHFVSEGLFSLVVVDLCMFAGFFGAFALAFSNFLYKHPVMPISDPLLDKGINRHH